VGLPIPVFDSVSKGRKPASRPGGKPKPKGTKKAPEGKVSRKARRRLRAIERAAGNRELGGVSAITPPAFAAAAADFPPLVSQAHPPVPSKPKGPRPASGTSPSFKKRVAGAARVPVGDEEGARTKVPLLGGLPGAPPKGDGWSGSSFLERVSLAAAAAAGIKKADASSLTMQGLAARGDAPAMKRQSANHRSKWILESGSRVDAQLSFVGRALPPAPREAVRAALSQHREDYTSSFEVPDDALTACRSFVRRWAKTHLVRSKGLIEAPSWPSGSSCLERTSKRGGCLSHVLSCAEKEEPPVRYLSDPVAVSVAQDISFLTPALRELAKGEVPLHRVTCLSERGLKTRVVTVGPAWCQVLGHSVRKRLLRGLRATKGAYQPLVGATDDEICSLFDGSIGETLVSTDLTRATDLIPLPLARAVVDGLADSGRLSALELDVLRALTGPQRLLYGSEVVTSSRGILMGLPTSWAVLSLIHLYWMDHAKHAALSSWRGGKTPRIRFSICGDDALLSTTRVGADSYKWIVGVCGGEPSKGKHFECESADGLRRAVFLEKLLEWERVGGVLVMGRRFPAIPVKGLTSRNLPRDFTEDRLVSCRSWGIRQVLSLDAIASQNECLLGPCKDYMMRRAPWLPAYATTVLGLIGGFPLAIGGFRFSPRPLDLSPAVEVRDSGRSFSLAIQRELDPSWRMAAMFSKEGRNLAIAEGELVDRPLARADALQDAPPAPYGWVVVSEEERLLRTVLPVYRQLVSFSSGPKRRTIHLRASDFVRVLTGLRAEGRSRPSGFPVDVPLAPAQIEWRLPNRETPERGLSWYDATEFNRSAYEAEVLQIVLENLGLASSYRA